MAGPLAGIRIVDLTSVVAGPLATQMLGDMGADVIKIESPEGDAPRHTGPSRSPGMAALFMGLNRSKRSLVLDLKNEGARDAMWRLISIADVLVHSMRPQKIAKLGFGHDTVCACHPRLIYAALHGYREGGPYSGQPAYDDVIQGQSGIAALMAEVAGEPRYAPMILADKTCALAIAGAISAALFARERTGRGHHGDEAWKADSGRPLEEPRQGHRIRARWLPELEPHDIVEEVGRSPYEERDCEDCEDGQR